MTSAFLGQRATSLACFKLISMRASEGISAAIFYKQIGRDLENLRAHGENFPQTAGATLCKVVAEPDSCRSIRGASTEATVHSSALSTAAIGHVADVEPGAPQGPDWQSSSHSVRLLHSETGRWTTETMNVSSGSV